MAVTFCRKCQAIVERGEQVCSRCFTPVKRPSILRTMLKGLSRLFGPSRRVSVDVRSLPDVSRSLDITTRTSHRLTVRDENTGEVREYDNIDQLPPKLRAIVGSLTLPGGSVKIGEKFGGFDITDVDIRESRSEQSITRNIVTTSDGSKREEFIVRSDDGAEQRYASVEEMPEELQRLVERFDENRGVRD